MGIIDPKGAESVLIHNSLDQLERSIHPDSGIKNFIYDLNNNINHSIIEGLGEIFYGYDKLNRLDETRAYFFGTEVSYEDPNIEHTS